MKLMPIRLLSFMLLMSLCAESAFAQSPPVLIQNPTTGYFLSARPSSAPAVPKSCFGPNNVPLGRPSSDNSIRVYTKNECVTILQGSYYPDGQCLRGSISGSWSYDCRILNSYSLQVSMVGKCDKIQLCYWSLTPQNQLVLSNTTWALTYTVNVTSSQNLKLTPLAANSSALQMFYYNATSMTVSNAVDGGVIDIVGANKNVGAIVFSNVASNSWSQQFLVTYPSMPGTVPTFVPLVWKYEGSVLCPPANVTQPLLAQPYTSYVNSCLWQRIQISSGVYQYVLPQFGWALSYNPTLTNNQLFVKPYNASIDVSQTFTNSNGVMTSSLDSSSNFTVTFLSFDNYPRKFVSIEAAYYNSLYEDAGYNINISNDTSAALLCNNGAAVSGVGYNQIFCYSVFPSGTNVSSTLTSVPRVSTWTCPVNAVINGLDLGSTDTSGKVENWVVSNYRVIGVLCAAPSSNSGYVVSPSTQFLPRVNTVGDFYSSDYYHIGTSGACSPGFVYQKFRESNSQTPVCVPVVTQAVANSNSITFPWSMMGRWFVGDSYSAQYRFDGEFLCNGFLTKYELKDWPSTISSWIGINDLNPHSKQQFMTCQVFSNNVTPDSTSSSQSIVGQNFPYGTMGLWANATCPSGTAATSLGKPGIRNRQENTFQNIVSAFNKNHSLRFSPFRRVPIGSRALQCASINASNFTTSTGSSNDGTFDCGNGYLNSVSVDLRTGQDSNAMWNLGTLTYSCLVPV